MSDPVTVPSFASVPHPRRAWQIIRHYLSDQPAFSELIECLAEGISDTNEIAKRHGFTAESVEIRKAYLHAAVTELEASLRERTKLGVSLHDNEK